MISRAGAWTVVSLLAAGVLLAGFPPAPPELRWAVAAAVAFGILGFSAPRPGAAIAAFASATAGGAAVFLGGEALCPWVPLIVLWFGAGCLFRELVFGRAPDDGDGVSRALEPLAILWVLASVAAALSARSLWAVSHRLDMRILNGKGMTDAEALAANLDSLASVFSGIVLYRVLRGLGTATARRALKGAMAGAVLSCVFALLQGLGWVAAPRTAFWRTSGRLQGLCSDPNALGVLAGLAIPVAVAGGLFGARRLGWWIAAFVLAAGLAESGSRSGFLVALGGAAIVGVVAVRRPELGLRALAVRGRRWWIFAALAVLGVILASDRRVGGLSQRLISIFDRDVPLEFRVSARPILWQGAWKAWKANPIAGLGWNAFSWQLPNLSPAAASMPGYDNPGNFYLQVLTETGLAGMIVFAGFLWAAGRTIVRGLRPNRRSEPFPLLFGSAGALAAFAAAMFFGSHLLAAEVSCLAFILLAQFRDEGRPLPARGIGRRIALVAAAAAWTVAVAGTRRPEAAFRYSSGMGFFAPERSPEGEFRWSGRRCAIRLAPGERRRVGVVFHSPSEAVDQLRVDSGGRGLYSKALERDRPIRLDLFSASDRPAVLIFENSSAFRPSAYSSSRDSRELSIQVFSEP